MSCRYGEIMNDENPGRPSSASKLRRMLAASNEPLRMYLTEAQYHMQVNYTCQLLDVVDEIADEETAARITDGIGGRLAGDEAIAAAERIRDTQERLAVVRMNQGAPGRQWGA